jgi:hypothetical protein
MIPGLPVTECSQSKEERRVVGQPFLGDGVVSEAEPRRESGRKPG